jgi:hypothetical protein
MGAKKAKDPHKGCPPPVWAGTKWECRNHSPAQVVPILREPYVAPGSEPRAAAPVARPVVNKDLGAQVAALETKLLALTEDHAKLQATVDAMKSS